MILLSSSTGARHSARPNCWVDSVSQVVSRLLSAFLGLQVSALTSLRLEQAWISLWGSSMRSAMPLRYRRPCSLPFASLTASTLPSCVSNHLAHLPAHLTTSGSASGPCHSRTLSIIYPHLLLCIASATRFKAEEERDTMQWHICTARDLPPR